MTDDDLWKSLWVLLNDFEGKISNEFLDYWSEYERRGIADNSDDVSLFF